MGYHVAQIKKGTLGQLSKVQEELDELVDAEEQGVKILQLCELSDLVGAIKAYVLTKHPNFELRDFEDMARLTEKAFKDGGRK